jgi:hypothetical protein
MGAHTTALDSGGRSTPQQHHKHTSAHATDYQTYAYVPDQQLQLQQQQRATSPAQIPGHSPHSPPTYMDVPVHVHVHNTRASWPSAAHAQALYSSGDSGRGTPTQSVSHNRMHMNMYGNALPVTAGGGMPDLQATSIHSPRQMHTLTTATDAAARTRAGAHSSHHDPHLHHNASAQPSYLMSTPSAPNHAPPLQINMPSVPLQTHHHHHHHLHYANNNSISAPSSPYKSSSSSTTHSYPTSAPSTPAPQQPQQHQHEQQTMFLFPGHGNGMSFNTPQPYAQAPTSPRLNNSSSSGTRSSYPQEHNSNGFSRASSSPATNGANVQNSAVLDGVSNNGMHAHAHAHAHGGSSMISQQAADYFTGDVSNVDEDAQRSHMPQMYARAPSVTGYAPDSVLVV